MPQDRRPPKPWWESCIRGVEGDDKAKVCGRIWTRIRPSVQARIQRNAERFRAGQETEPEAAMSQGFLTTVLAGAAQAAGATIAALLVGRALSKPPAPGAQGGIVQVVDDRPTIKVVDDRASRCKPDETWDARAGLCRPKVAPPAGGVVSPAYVQGDQAQVDVGTLLQDIDAILKKPETMGEVDVNTLRVIRG